MEVLAVIGLGLIVIGGIWTIVAAFKTSIGWGIGCFLIPPVSLVFIFKHWDEAKTPFSPADNNYLLYPAYQLLHKYWR